MAHTNINYIILEADDADELRRRVIERLHENWLPIGGVIVVATGDDNYVYAQAMGFCIDD